MWGQIAQAVGDQISNYTNKFVDYDIGKWSTKYSANKSLENASALTAFQSQVGRQDYSWQKQLDYYYDAVAYYQLAQKYAENSAKWNVTGLRNAGLNPILAATDGNFSSTYGTGSSSGSMSHPSASSSVPYAGRSSSAPSVSDALSKAASADLAMSNSQTTKALRVPTVGTAYADLENKTKQGQILDATKDKIDAESDMIRANTAKTLTDTVDTKYGGKVSGFANMIGRAMSWFNDDRSDQAAAKQADNAGLKHFIRNSAKDDIQELKSDERRAEEFEEFLRSQSSDFERYQRSRKASLIHTR